jgi:hypothetical protein
MGDAVFIGVPTYDGRVEATTVMAVATATRKWRMTFGPTQSSLLCKGCNTLWAAALMKRKEGVKWFAMLHADVSPEDGWIDTLIGEAEKHDADVMSAVVPIKDDLGVTSTSIEDPADPWLPFTRITQSQINHEAFPTTFDAFSVRNTLGTMPNDLRVLTPDGRLQVNTGCMVARIDKPWAEQIHFHIEDRIIREGDAWGVQVQPEDWLFSRDVADLGGRVMATKSVAVVHRGAVRWHSRATWGEPVDTFKWRQLA